MIDADDIKTVLNDLVLILTDQQIKFHVTGGLATSYYGEPRFTQDIDIVIRLSPKSDVSRLRRMLSEKFLVDAEEIYEVVKRSDLFHALHEKTIIKVDFHVGEAIPGELARSRSVEILSGTLVPLVSKEDSILSKLIWLSKGSHKNRRDVEMMLVKPNGVDQDYLSTMASKLGIKELWSEVCR